MDIGFIGLGTMGAPMARNLLKAGHELRVFDVSADARAALAAHQQGKYLAVYDALMNERALNVEAIDRILQANGVDLPRAKAAIASPEMTRHIADIHTTAAALRLRGTPTFFVNGKASPGIDPAEIGKLIEAAKR